MRFVELAVEGFQALERAHVSLGPGLNVLYGPNDLGKSTLAGAIRAALLVPYRSAEAKSFSSWYADAPPRVQLTFLDDQEHFWQIKKTFGAGASAELRHSKERKDFTIECKTREVDQRVRELLQWGVAALGGTAGASRGLPESFLAKVLLAAQTDVDDILAASLEHDKADSGKLRLRKALAALAQHPLFKSVLDRAKQEYDVYFTPQGKPRRAEGSKLVAADKAVKAHTAELDRLRSEREESRGIEEQARVLYDACARAEHALGAAEAQLTSARQGLVNTQQRSAAEVQLKAAEAALAEIDAQAARVAALEAERVTLGGQLEERRGTLEEVARDADRLAELQRAAAAELQRVNSGAAEQARKLRELDLEREAAELRAARRELDARKEEVQRASRAAEARDEAARALAACQGDLTSSSQQLQAKQAALATAEIERDLARGVVAYGRFREAEDAARSSQKLRDDQTALTQKSTALEDEADVLRAQHAQRAAELAQRRAKLPTPERFKQLDALRQQLERVEASLGGGLSIRITPRRPDVALRATLDRVPVPEAALGSEQTYEAERNAQLVVGDLVEIEISAGAADKRRELSKLRTRWDAEVVPVLELAAVATLASAESALSALQLEDAAAAALQQQVDTRDSEARAARERAGLIAQQLAGQASFDVAARRAAIGSIAHDLLEPRWSKLGRDWEAKAEPARERAEQLYAAARDACTKQEQALSLLRFQHGEAEARVRERTEEATALSHVLQGKSASMVLRALAAELELSTKRAAELDALRAGLAAEAGAERVTAEQALTRAQAVSEAARAKQAEQQRALEDTRSELDTATGSARAESARLTSMDRASAQQRLAACTAHLDACPSAPLASEGDVAAAERDLTRARNALAEHREELHKAEGALTRVGGAQLQDRLQQAKEALDTARARERELRTDADSWKLLREALVQAETEESDHLGAALGRPVGEKLRELTGGRYREVSFDQHMKAGNVRAQGATPDAEVLEALSVGTRNQLATLVRLTIASQLKSAIVLDDHLVHTDPTRLGWFRDLLRKTALDSQVLIFTCRPEDYLQHSELPSSEASRDLAGGAVRAVDLSRALQRWSNRP
jgi:hypothetical protein